jgi:hypothetical protein
MAAVDVEMSPAVHAKEPSTSTSPEEEDLYIKLKNLQRTLEFLDIQVAVALCATEKTSYGGHNSWVQRRDAAKAVVVPACARPPPTKC